MPLRPRRWWPPASNTQDGRGGGREVPVSPHAGLLLARARPRPAGCPQPFLPSLAGSAGTKPISTLRLVRSGNDVGVGFRWGCFLHSGIAQACFSSSLLGVGAHEVLLLEGSPEPQWKWDSVTGVGGMP